MALPGMRGYGRDDNFGRNSSYGRTRTSNNDFINTTVSGFNRTKSAGLTNAAPDPTLGRRIDTMDQRLNKHENAHRGILEQIMKLQQDFKMELKRREQTINEEKSMRMRMESALQGASNKLGELDERVKRVENSSKENKSALSQLINHTKNVERAVNLSQQDIGSKREQQASKLQELNHKINQIHQNKETLEKTCYVIRDEVREMDGKVETLQLEVQDFQGAVKMQSQYIEKIQTSRMAKNEEPEKEGRMTETQKAMLEAKIMQCQQTILDLNSKVIGEKRDRDSDLEQVNSRITDLVADMSDRDRNREAGLREQEAKARDQASLGSAEKQKIIMQISAVQTDIKRNLDERDGKLKELTVHKLEEMDAKMAENDRLRSQLERDLRALVDAEMEKQNIHTEHGIDTIKSLVDAENEKTRARIQEQTDAVNDIDATLRQVKSELLDELTRVEHDGEAREKVLDAKIEDLSDKLRFGMATMQAAIGENQGGGGGGGEGLPIEEVERLQDEAIDGVRESVAKQITDLEEEIKVMHTEIRKQNEVVEESTRRQEIAGEDANNILGDKLHQKMDSISFTQERMKRQVDELQEKISGAPNDIGDIRDRIEDIERAQSKQPTGEPTSQGSGDVEQIRRDLDKVLGRDSGEVDGIPSISKLQSEVDELNNNVALMQGSVRDLDSELKEKIGEEKQNREEEAGNLRKDVDRLEKKTKEIKERLKGKLGVNIPDDEDKDEEEGNE